MICGRLASKTTCHHLWESSIIWTSAAVNFTTHKPCILSQFAFYVVKVKFDLGCDKCQLAYCCPQPKLSKISCITNSGIAEPSE